MCDWELNGLEEVLYKIYLKGNEKTIKKCNSKKYRTLIHERGLNTKRARSSKYYKIIWILLR